MCRKSQTVLIGVAFMVALSAAAFAELGTHWWPAGNADWGPRAYHDVVEFQGSLYAIGGQEFLWNDSELGSVYGPTGEIWKSDDGISWILTADISMAPNTIAVATKNFVRSASFGVTSSFYYQITHDGLNWETRPNDLQIAGSLYGGCGSRITAFAELIWHFTAPQGQLQIRSSSDGNNWSLREHTPVDMVWPCLFGVTEFNNSLLALQSDSHENWISADGITWSPLPDGENAYDETTYIQDILTFKERIWLLTFQGIFWSMDSINWYGPASSRFEIAPRDHYAAVGFKERLWIYGGIVTNAPPGQEFLNDIWYSEDTAEDIHRADYLGADGVLELSEILRLVQLYQFGKYHCDGLTEDSYAPGEGYETCFPHSSDYNPQDWRIQLTELLRAIQFYNAGGYVPCPAANTEDGFCPLPGL